MMATGLIVLVVLVLPFTPLAGLLGFVRLPLTFYGWMGLIVAAYVGSAELAKKWFYRKLQKDY
jgi:Mg2+-importing ATPase